MLTDEKKAMMLASFDVFRRPTPKMYRIQKSHDLAVHYWGLGVPLTHNSLKELWFKLYRERRAAVFNDRELRIERTKLTNSSFDGMEKAPRKTSMPPQPALSSGP